MEILVVTLLAYLYAINQNRHRRTITDLALIIAMLAFALGLLVADRLVK